MWYSSCLNKASNQMCFFVQGGCKKKKKSWPQVWIPHFCICILHFSDTKTFDFRDRVEISPALKKEPKEAACAWRTFTLVLDLTNSFVYFYYHYDYDYDLMSRKVSRTSLKNLLFKTDRQQHNQQVACLIAILLYFAWRPGRTVVTVVRTSGCP